MATEEDQRPVVNVQSIMRDIRARARAETQQKDQLYREVRKTIPPHLFASVSKLREVLPRLRSDVAQIGVLPPSPPSLRGKLGALLIRVVQRALFWLLPPLRNTHEGLLVAFEEQSRTNEEMLKLLHTALVDLEILRRAAADVSSQRGSLSSS